MLGRLYIEY